MLLFLYFLLLIGLIETCPLKTVDIRSGCYCGIEIDGTNYIHCHPGSINRIPEFTRSYIHETLNLSNNAIKMLTNTSFHQLKVKRIYLEDNPIQFIDPHAFNHHLLHYLEELYIETRSNHSLEFLCSGSWRKLRILKLSGFDFHRFQTCFNQLNRLEKLIIQNSQINLISSHISKLPFLHELSLIHNQLESLQFDDESPLHSSSIRVLNLTFNQLRTIPNDLNLRLPHLITLDLSHNFIEQFPLMNQITTLNINLSFNLIHYFQLNYNQHFIDLSSNPICTMEKSSEIVNVVLNNLTNLHCDCRLASFLKGNFSDLWRLFGDQSRCGTPKIFQGIFVKDLTDEQLMSKCVKEELPANCQEVTNLEEIQEDLNTTQITETMEKPNDPSIFSFRLTSFSTLYEKNDLLIFWDFDINPSSADLSNTQVQLIIEQEISSKTEVIRRTDFLSPYLKQYIIPQLSSNQDYYVCLLLTRVSYGTEKYCRETRTSTHQTFLQMFLHNRSIIFGFLVGTVLTTSILITLAFICHLHDKRKYSHSLFTHQQQQQRYMYITRNDLDGTYSHSIISSPSSKYQHLRKTRHRSYLTPIPPWYNRNSRQLPSNPRSPCCFLQYHDRTLSSSITTNRITSLSSDYSNGIEKEQMTSTSLMSNISFDEHANEVIQSPTKHLYEELGDTNIFL